jgi:hypothetical protein
MSRYIIPVLLVVLSTFGSNCKKHNDNHIVNNCGLHVFVNKDFQELIFKAPDFNMYNTTFYFEDILLQDDLIIDSSSFMIIYQADTLIEKYNPNNDYGYLIGKDCNKDFIALVIARFYGEWIKTFELLTYDKKGNLVGFMFLAASGGEDYYESKGHFKNDTTYALTTISKEFDHSDIDLLGKESRLIRCDTSVTYSIIRNDGKIAGSGSFN